MKLNVSDSGSKSQKFRKVGGPWGCLKQEDFPDRRVKHFMRICIMGNVLRMFSAN